LDLDVVVLDIEDGVAPNRKEEARNLIKHTLENEKFFPHTERSIRMNHVGSGLEDSDLQECILPSIKNLHSVLIPKVETTEQLQYVASHLEKALPGESSPFELIAAIESAKGIANLKEICSTKLPPSIKLTGLVYASEDLCADMGITRTSSRLELLYTRQALVCHAKAFEMDAIDLVCIDFKNEEALIVEATEGSQMGFTGKQAIHPNQIGPIYKAFSPKPEIVQFARDIVEGFEKCSQQGIGAFDLNGKMIDMPMVKWAERILRLVD